MNGKVVLSFILGAAGGAVGMYFGMKQAYEAYIDKEIEKFKTDYETSHECKCDKKCQNDNSHEEDLEKEVEKDADSNVEKINYAKIRTPDIEKIDEVDMEKKVDGGLKMTPKECLIQFKETYCEKDPKNNKDPEFRCDKCLFRQNNICLINAFISRQFEKED